MAARVARLAGVLAALWGVLVAGAGGLGAARTAEAVSFVYFPPATALATLDPATGVVYRLLTPTPGDLILDYAWSPDGQRLAVNVREGDTTALYIRERGGGWRVLVRSLLSPRVHWGADGAQLVLLNGTGYTLLDPTTGALATISVAGGLFAETDFFVPLGPTTALIRGQAALSDPLRYYTLHLPTGELGAPPPLPCANNPTSYHAGRAPAGGWRAVYVCVREGGIFLADAGTAPRTLYDVTIIDDLRYFRRGVWLSPRGTRVLLHRNSVMAGNAGRAGVYVYDLETESERRVLGGYAVVNQAQWGPPLTPGSSR